MLPNIGPVYKIAETDLLEFMEYKLQQLNNSGELAKINARFKAKAMQAIEEPTPVIGIINTKTPKKFYYDPTVSPPFDLKDHQGKVFHKKGNTVNPLDTVTLTENLLFIDGTDKNQINWALAQPGSIKPDLIILVKGKPLALMRQLNRQIYFDQYGQISKKLAITQVPARVSQIGTKLLIEEIKLD